MKLAKSNIVLQDKHSFIKTVIFCPIIASSLALRPKRVPITFELIFSLVSVNSHSVSSYLSKRSVKQLEPYSLCVMLIYGAWTLLFFFSLRWKVIRKLRRDLSLAKKKTSPWGFFRETLVYFFTKNV